MTPTQYVYVTGENPNGKFGQRFAERLISTIKRISDIKRVCELGCGNGYFSGELIAAGYEVVGIDSSVSGIEYAKKNYGKTGQFLRSEISPDLSANTGLKNFDLVISIEVIEHLYCPSDLIETAATLLRPNGFLLLTTPYHGYLKNLALAITNRMDTHYNSLFDGGHIKFFSVKTLSRLVSGGGVLILSLNFLAACPGFGKT